MTDVETYFDDWSGIYDAELAANDGEDVAYYRDRAVDADGPVLELGPGTGRIYLELLDAGVDAYGIDVSAEMLDRLREKASDRGLDPRVARGDVATLDYRDALGVEGGFALVLAPADVFLYNLTVEDQLATLENVRDALAPGGEATFDYFTPDFETICEQYGTEVVTEVERDGEPYEIRSVLEFADEVDRIVEAERAVYDRDGGLVVESTATFTLLPRREMRLLLERAGFADHEVDGGFDGEPLTEDADRMVWVAREP